MAELKREPWKATEEHRKAAQEVESDVSSQAFSDLSNRDRWTVYGVGKLVYDDPEDPPAEATDEEKAAYAEMAPGWDYDTWPMIYRDEAGRRYEVDVQVMVRPLPDVVREQADRAEMLAWIKGQQALPLEVDG